MSDISNIEKRNFESLLGMNSGYVLSFSNRTFDEFFIDSVGVSILDEKYNSGSGSKANRLRSFWKEESNEIVAKVLGDLLRCVSLEEASPETKKQYDFCSRTVARLAGLDQSAELIELQPNSTEREFAVLARAVRESIERNEPEVGLDRLHTFAVK